MWLNKGWGRKEGKRKKKGGKREGGNHKRKERKKFQLTLSNIQVQ